LILYQPGLKPAASQEPTLLEKSNPGGHRIGPLLAQRLLVQLEANLPRIAQLLPPEAAGGTPESGDSLFFRSRTGEFSGEIEKYLGPEWARTRGGHGELAGVLYGRGWGQMRAINVGWPFI
jgi:hypothetical protein